ncbi:hypothetical protein CL634_03365 [bacterium]|nr:hypothetical protein [bacterium]
MRSGNEVKSYVLFQINRGVVDLYKKYIIMTEDLRNEHLRFIQELEENNSKESLRKIDYFDDSKYNYIRKKILDAGNEVIRDLEKNFDMIEVRISSEYLETITRKDRKKEDYEKLENSL